MTRASLRASTVGWSSAILVGLVLRALLSLRAPLSVDLKAYGEVTRALGAGKPLYEGTDHDNDPPARAWVIRSVERISGTVLLFLAPGALTGGAGYLLFTLFSTAWILGSHFAFPGSGQWFGQLVWLSIAFWGFREIRAARDRARVPRGSPA